MDVARGTTPLPLSAFIALGMIGQGKETGYEIKAAIERSTRFFCGASYGTIYPDLRLLDERDLVEAREAPRGGRRRRAYRLTPAGAEVLERWLRSPDAGAFLFRDELLARLFFAGRLPVDDALSVVQRLRRRHDRELAALEAIQREHAGQVGQCERLSLELGLEVEKLMVAWSSRAEEELERSRS